MKNKKGLRLIALFAVICIMVNASAIACFADNGIDVYVTIANNGAPVVCQADVYVTDVDNDGSITINDALIVTHTQFYSGGSKGYESAVGQYGLGITKLWGNTNNGSFGYYVNNASAWSLTDVLSDNDDLYAFCYQDAANWTDSYAYFDAQAVYFDSETAEFTFTLSMLGYDEDWNTVELPVANAIITFDGADTEYVTDENGKVTVTIDRTKTHIVSARTDDYIITPPVVTVNPDETGNEFICTFNGNKYYYVDNAVITGWKKLSGKWHYFDNSGAMQTGWEKVDGKWYFMNADGVMQTGWKKVDGKWYYLNKSGVMQTGWKKVDGKWYYLNKSGVMQTGWLKSGGNWYYLNGSGVMVTGWQTINNKNYYFDNGGKWIKNAVKK